MRITMNNRPLHTAAQWIDVIAHSELPAITSTAKMLDKFSNDDKSSLPKLSEAILHDQALSSCLLKIANNIQHIGVNKVTTVSRATVVLGIQSVKNICLTSKLVSSLLASENLDINVYNKLTQLMASSFHAGMLAKMMVPSYSEEVQEEVYLSAMLYRIGETAFWSTGGDTACELAAYGKSTTKDFQQHCQELLGTNFHELSKGLASTWNLSDLLIKALDQPTSRTDEIKVIYYADKLSAIIADPSVPEEEYQQLLIDIAAVMKISTSQLKARIDNTQEKACKLLSTYGAEFLTDRIRSLPTSKDFAQSSEQGLKKVDASKEMILLTAFMNLTALMKTSKDLNEYLTITLVDMAAAFSFDRSSFLMLADGRTQVKSRIVVDHLGDKLTETFILPIQHTHNVIDLVLKSDTPTLLNHAQQQQWQHLIPDEFNTFIEKGVMALLPVKIGERCIGIITAQKINSDDDIALDEDRKSVV